MRVGSRYVIIEATGFYLRSRFFSDIEDYYITRLIQIETCSIIDAAVVIGEPAYMTVKVYL